MSDNLNIEETNENNAEIEDIQPSIPNEPTISTQLINSTNDPTDITDGIILSQPSQPVTVLNYLDEMFDHYSGQDSDDPMIMYCCCFECDCWTAFLKPYSIIFTLCEAVLCCPIYVLFNCRLREHGVWSLTAQNLERHQQCQQNTH
jgi:hypothetical protein